MLMLIIAVAIGVVIGLTIYNNPDAVIGLIKIGVIAVAALVVIGLIFIGITSLWTNSTKPATPMVPVNVKSGISQEDSVIDSALAAHTVINAYCTQKMFAKNAGIEFEYSHSKFIIVASSCVPEGGNQVFSFINLMEVNPSGTISVKDVIKFTGSLNRMYIENGMVNISYLGYGPNDAKCCPSLPMIDQYRMGEGRLLPK